MTSHISVIFNKNVSFSFIYYIIRFVDTSSKHYTLTNKQLKILNLLYRFRFATAELISNITDLNIRTVNERLKLMMNLGYIGRHYGKEYRVERKPAVYYMAETGIGELKELNVDGRYALSSLRSMKNDEGKSERFINHQLTVLETYAELLKGYDGEVQFFTKAQLAGLAHYPKPLPDASVRGESRSGYKQRPRGSD